WKCVSVGASKSSKTRSSSEIRAAPPRTAALADGGSTQPSAQTNLLPPPQTQALPRMPWRHLIFPVKGSTYIDPQLVTLPAPPTPPVTTLATMQSFLGTKGNTPASPMCADSIPNITLERLVDLLGKKRPLGSTIFPPSHVTREMPHHEFVRRVTADRGIAREARLDAVLSKDLEPWSLTSSTSATEDALKAAHTEDQNEEVLDEANIARLSLLFQGDELNDLRRPSASPPQVQARPRHGQRLLTARQRSASSSPGPHRHCSLAILLRARNILLRHLLQGRGLRERVRHLPPAGVDSSQVKAQGATTTTCTCSPSSITRCRKGAVLLLM
ncbi:hypothetical protein T484DRAFT_3228172, partial [Baffinella frigidus]